MGKILFMMPSYYNFDDVVREGLIKYSNHDVIGIDTSSSQAYRHFGDRLLNFFSKVFLNKNIKSKMRSVFVAEKVDKYDKYDFFIANRPDLIDDDVLEKAIEKSKKSILLLWDSLEKISLDFRVIDKFDIKYSFDSGDCKKYGFQKIENFHFFDHIEFPEPTHDLVFLGTLDNRIDGLKSILNRIENKNMTVKAYLYVPPNKILIEHPNIEKLDKIIPFKDSGKFAASGKIILDIGHSNQQGLSFRVYEAMALGKKLITTNQHIRDYEFYNENNVFIIDNVYDFEIPKAFFSAPYVPLASEIVKKYHIESWVKRILNEE